MRTTVTVIVEHRKHIADLADMVAARAYTLDGVTDVIVQLGQLQEMAVIAGDPPAPLPKLGWLDRIFGNLGKRA